MNYYAHHIGDYRRDTAHLTLLEHGIYRQLLDQYYLDEHPLCADDAKLMRTHCVRNADEVQAFKNVLKDFFTLTDLGYIHGRCEVEITRFYRKSDKAREAANARWLSKKCERNADGMRTHSERNANGMLPNTQYPIYKTKKENNKKKKENVPEKINFYDVPQKVIDDFLTLRKIKKAPVTQTAINRIRSQADKACISLEDALILCCSRGWIGFEATWIDRDKEKNQVKSFTSNDKAKEWADKLIGSAKNDRNQDIIDI